MAVVGPSITLTIPPKTEYLSLARLVVTAAAELPGAPLFDDDRLDDLRLAVSEALTNAIKANATVGGREVVVRCLVGKDQLDLAITDQGAGVDARVVDGVPELKHVALIGDGGLGIPLMRALCDEFDFSSGTTGTTVCLGLRVRPPPATD